MVTLTRLVARQLRAVLGKLPNKPTYISLQAGGEGLRVLGQGQTVAVEYHELGACSPCSLAVSISLLKEIEGSKPQPVTLTPTTDNRVTATWLDGQVPCSLTVDTREPTDQDPTFPTPPTTWLDNDPSLLRALADATQTSDPSSSRYALGCLQLCGKTGVIAATDGRQLLKQSGFRFPFEDEVLILGTKLFACKELSHGDSVQVGRTADHVIFRTGRWTLYLAIQKAGRFPRIDDIIPRPEDALATVDLDPSDQEFLSANLRRLPIGTEQFQEVTLDLNGSVAIRAKRGDDSPTELVLSNSRKAGGDLAICTDRRFLQRAAQLGFVRLHAFGLDRPVFCQDERRQFVWMLLDKSGIVPRSPDATQVRSPVTTTAPTIHSTRTIKLPKPKRKATVEQAHSPATAPIHTAMQPTVSPRHSSQSALDHSPLDQAIKLRASLREALLATNDLVRAIKLQKKQDRALRSTLASLRQLQAVA